MSEKTLRRKLKDDFYRVVKVRGEENCYKLIHFQWNAFCGYYTFEELVELVTNEE